MPTIRPRLARKLSLQSSSRSRFDSGRDGRQHHPDRKQSRLRLRLDSARFLTEALSLYRSSGFREISAYPGCEISAELHDRWFFLEKEPV